MTENTHKPSEKNTANSTCTRRDLIKAGGALATGLAAHSLSGQTVTPSGESCALAFGVITDLHYADKDMAIERYYRESADKLRQSVETFNTLKPSFIIELGDFIDKAEKTDEIDYLMAIDSIYAAFNGPRHYVIGNHDVATFSKGEFVRLSGAVDTQYSFDSGPFHFVILDGNFNADGSDYDSGNFTWTETYIPQSRIEWLRGDLERAGNRTSFVFIHQNLHDETNPHGVKNAPEVRSVLERDGNVRAVFQGHDHAGARARIKGISYVTFESVVNGSGLDNNGGAMVYILKDGGIRVDGFGKQDSFEL